MSSISSTTSGQEPAGSIGAPDAGSGKTGRPILWLAALGAMYLINLCVFAQWNNPMSPPGQDELDSAWMMVLQWAQVHHVDFGNDLIHTHGPWGFAAQWCLPGTFPKLAAAWLLLSTAYFAGLVRIARYVTPSKWMAALWLFTTILLTGLPIDMLDARLLMMSWLLLLTYFFIDDRAWSASSVLLTVGMALAALMKFSFFAAALPVVAVIGIDQILRRRIPWTPIVYAAALAGLWVATGQSLDGLGPYLKHSWEVSSAYSEGAMLYRQSELLDVSQYVLTAILILVAMSLAHPWKWLEKQEKPKGVLDEIAKTEEPTGPPPLLYGRSFLSILGTAGLLLINFKGGYVRHDAHELAATASLAIMAVTLGAVLWPRIQSGVAQTFVVLLCLGAICLSWDSQKRFTSYSGPDCVIVEIMEIPFRAANDVEAIFGNPGPLKATSQHVLPAAPPALPHVDGTVDIYPWDQRRLLTQGMDYDPRPVFQGYLAFTPSLLELNARYLASPNAARTILFDLATIDSHYMTLDDSLSLPELLTRYDLTDASGTHLVLRKAETPRQFELVPLGTASGNLGHWISVPPSDDPIWVTVDVRLTPLGQLARFFYKPPSLSLGVHTQSQQTWQFRLQRQIAQAGFLLSPKVTDRMEFGMLYSPGWKAELPDDVVTDMAVRCDASFDGTSAFYQEQYAIHYFALRYPHEDISRVPGMQDYRDLRGMFERMTVNETPNGSRPQLLENDDGKISILTGAESRLFIPAPRNAREFHIGFGMLNSTYAVNDPTDGVTFQIYLVDTMLGHEASAALVFSRQLDPANLRMDRGLQEATITLPTDRHIYGVLLVAVPGPQNRRSDLYWTDLKFR